MKRICLIGSGNVAEAFAVALGGLHPAGRFRLGQIYARNRARGAKLARMAGCDHTDDPAQLVPADIYLISVSDTQIGAIAENLDFGNAIVAHTAGSVSLNVLPDRLSHRGVFYPLQTFTAGRRIDFRQVPLLIEGEHPDTAAALRLLASELSDSVYEVSEQQRAQLHLAAVFACNFTNHMYAIAQELLAEKGLPPQLIGPLISETAAKALGCPSAAAVQTGPARRGDRQTQQKHLGLLEGHPQLQELYQKISTEIWETSKRI